MIPYGFNPWPWLIFGIVSLFLLLGSLLFNSTATISHKEAVQHGCARYHPQTGEFEWLEPAPTD